MAVFDAPQRPDASSPIAVISPYHIHFEDEPSAAPAPATEHVAECPLHEMNDLNSAVAEDTTSVTTSRSDSTNDFKQQQQQQAGGGSSSLAHAAGAAIPGASTLPKLRPSAPALASEGRSSSSGCTSVASRVCRCPPAVRAARSHVASASAARLSPGDRGARSVRSESDRGYSSTIIPDGTTSSCTTETADSHGARERDIESSSEVGSCVSAATTAAAGSSAGATSAGASRVRHPLLAFQRPIRQFCGGGNPVLFEVETETETGTGTETDAEADPDNESHVGGVAQSSGNNESARSPVYTLVPAPPAAVAAAVGASATALSTMTVPVRMPQFTFALCALPDGTRLPANAPIRYVMMDPSAARIHATGNQSGSSPLFLLSQNPPVASSQPQVRATAPNNH